MFSDPVVGKKFFGRSETIDLLSKRVDGLKDGFRQNIAILGPSLIGKSSLILHFFSSFSHPQIIPIYIDLRANSFSHFVYKFIRALLYHFLKNKNLQTSEEFQELKKLSRDHIPKTVEAITLIENSMKTMQLEKAYETLLGLSAILRQEANFYSIVILDNFHVLGRYKLRAPFAYLAKEIMLQKDTMYVFASSQVNYAKNVLNNELSLLFGNFEVIHLEHFDYPTSCRFLEQRFLDIKISKHLQDFLIDFSKGHPFYLDILSSKLLEQALGQNKKDISCNLIAEAFNSLIFDSKGILNQYFTNLLTHSLNGADYSNFLPILLSASQRASQFRHISKLTAFKPKAIAKQLNYLVEKDLLSKVGTFYRIQDRLFRFWLKSVYHRKSLSLSSNPNTEAGEFSKEIEEQIARFSQESKAQLTEKITDLLRTCNNEIVMLQNKLFKFWQFTQIQRWPKANSSESIIAHYKEGCWVFWIKMDGVDENHLQEFIDLCKESKLKIRRVIAISLKELDLNVRLMALEKKIWIWTLADLNLLLDLYGKQQIIAT